MTEPQDLFEKWKGEVQRLRDHYEAQLNLERINGRRRTQRAAHEAQEATEGYRRSQEHVQSLTGALQGARERLEKMHAPGCLRVGYDCPACEAIDDLDSW